MCGKQCSSEDFLLHDFSHSGIGVQGESFEAAHLPDSTSPYCLWLVAPSSNYNTTFLHLSQLSSVRQFNSSIHPSLIFNFTIQFSSHSNHTKSSSPGESCDCDQETVLVYDGLPQDLNVLYRRDHWLNDGSQLIPERLVASLTGCQLSNTELQLLSPFLTMVYFYNGNSSDINGFSASIMIGTLELPDSTDSDVSEGGRECVFVE